MLTTVQLKPKVVIGEQFFGILTSLCNVTVDLMINKIGDLVKLQSTEY